MTTILVLLNLKVLIQLNLILIITKLIIFQRRPIIFINFLILFLIIKFLICCFQINPIILSSTEFFFQHLRFIKF